MKQFDIPAAKRAGMTDQQIQSFMQQNNLQPAKQSWLTEGETGLKGAWRGAMNLMNIPSYAIGGALRGAWGSDYYDNPIEGIGRGIKDKASVFREVPRSLSYLGVPGMEEGELPGMAVGLGAELLTPSTLSVLSKGAKMLGLFDKKAKLADVGDDLFKGIDAKQDAAKSKGLLAKGADSLRQYSEDSVTQGLGRNKDMTSFLNRVKKAGMTPDELFDKYDLWARDPDDVWKAWEIADKKLKAIASKSERAVDVRDVMKMFDDEIAKLSSEAVESDTARIIQDVLKERKGRFLDKIQQNIDGATSTPLRTTLGDVYETGSRAAKDAPRNTFGLDAAQSANAQGLSTTWDATREMAGNMTGGEARRLGSEMKALSDLQKLTNKARTASAGNQRLPLKSILTASAGGGVAGIPGAVGGYIVNQVAQSPTGAKVISRGARTGADFLQKASTQAPKMPQIGRPAIKAMQSIPRPVYKGIETVARVQPSFENQRKKKKNYPSYY